MHVADDFDCTESKHIEGAIYPYFVPYSLRVSNNPIKTAINNWLLPAFVL